jgi:hypothetical protein
MGSSQLLVPGSDFSEAGSGLQHEIFVTLNAVQDPARAATALGNSTFPFTEDGEHEGKAWNNAGGRIRGFNACCLCPDVCRDAGWTTAAGPGAWLCGCRARPRLRLDGRVLGPARRALALGGGAVDDAAASTRGLGERVLGAAWEPVLLALRTLAVAVPSSVAPGRQRIASPEGMFVLRTSRSAADVYVRLTELSSDPQQADVDVGRRPGGPPYKRAESPEL